MKALTKAMKTLPILSAKFIKTVNASVLKISMTVKFLMQYRMLLKPVVKDGLFYCGQERGGNKKSCPRATGNRQGLDGCFT